MTADMRKLYVGSVLAGFMLLAPLAWGQPVPPEKGHRIFLCAHSFTWFIEKPLELLAREAGFTDHTTVGVSKIGDSRAIQHWQIPEEQNLAKAALKNGQVDILTLSPHRKIPDEGIELFADYAFEHNPSIQVMAQISWPDFPLREDTDWQAMPGISDAYFKAMRAQADAINRRHGTAFVHLVPVMTAFLELRARIEAGTMPGIASFAELFKDPKGHPTKPLADLVTYCWFAAIYQKSPVGLTALDDPNDPASKERNRVLQQMAWDAVTGEPMSGVSPQS